MGALRFEICERDGASAARVGRVTTGHGSFETPTFMPVGTQASVKGLLPTMVAELGVEILLANTYHLMLRPGSELVAAMGGLHGWMRWGRPILTDSGGFQVFSLGDINRITEEGVIFKSHLDGQTIEMTPERSMQVQNELGADIIMAFDDCPPAAGGEESGGEEAMSGGGEAGGGEAARGRMRFAVARKDYAKRVRQANERTVAWLGRCVRAHGRREEQALFGIVQGGTDLAERTWCAERVGGFDLPGYAIGGVAVGEGYEALVSVVEHTARLLPTDKPRYLMGVGYERDILAAVRAGVDMFDCVLPTRNGRNANAFTSRGQIRLKNACFARDGQVIEPGCDCLACAGPGVGMGVGSGALEGAGGFSRSYIRHLFQVGEMLGRILVSVHNIRHFERYLLDIREAIRHNDWSLIAERWPVAVGFGR